MDTEKMVRFKRATFILNEEHIEILDDIIYHIKKKTGTTLNKSQIIRALISSLQKKNINFETITSEEVLIEQLTN